MPLTGPTPRRLTIEALAALAPEAWPQLTLKPHPTAIRLTFRTNAAEIWSALKEEAAPPKPRQLPEPQAIVVWRQDFMARFKPLTAEEAMMWNEAAKGVRVRRAVRDGGDLRRRGRGRASRRDLSQRLGRHGDAGGLPDALAPGLERSQPATARAAAAPETTHRSVPSANRPEARPIRARPRPPAASLRRPCRTAASRSALPRVR